MARQYTKGSEKPPPLTEGMRLYSMRFCPYAQRTRLVLAAKGIKYETCNINLKEKPEWFHEVSPDLNVPSLELPGGKFVWESLVSSDFLDEMFPDKNPLCSKDPFMRAKDKLAISFFDNKLIPLYYKIKLNKAGEDDVEAQKKNLLKAEQLLIERKSTFFNGDTPGMVDYMIYPHMRHAPNVDASSTPVLHNWVNAMNEDPAVQEANYPQEMLNKFTETYLKGEPDFLLGSDEKP